MHFLGKPVYLLYLTSLLKSTLDHRPGFGLRINTPYQDGIYPVLSDAINDL